MYFCKEDQEVSLLSKELALELGYSGKESEMIGVAALNHDLGKVFIPQSILQKPGKLTQQEYELVKTHTLMGALISHEVAEGLQKDMIELACLDHHENYDGSGYRQKSKLKVEEFVQIIHFVDVLVALQSQRSYKPRWTQNDIEDYIRANKGKLFNPKIVDAFFRIKQP